MIGNKANRIFIENKHCNEPLHNIERGDVSQKLISVNYHLTNACNYQCRFCFARFPQSHKILPLKKAKKLVTQLSMHGTKKITFVGGEPLLYPQLGELIRYTKNYNITTMIITNGSLLDCVYLELYEKYIDWIGFSLDSSIDVVNDTLGRRLKNSRKQNLTHIQRVRSLVPTVKNLGINVKINTVVTSLNWQEDMNWLIKELKPDRWKVFQVLKIDGENDRDISPLLITPRQFQHFIFRHQNCNPNKESNDAMMGSYIMIDPLGRFFDNTNGYLTFSRPILEVGVEKAFSDIQFSLKKFYQRGGHYNWDT
ncbi:MAG: viperin family antiviral radical SAM protein [Promethearchaeota archaeon]